MRIADVILVIPRFPLILVLVAFFGRNVSNIIFAIAVTYWPSSARLIRSEFYSVKERLFVEAERALGATDRRIIFRCILPNAIFPVVVNLSLQMASAILAEASLSFLGLGDPEIISLGQLLQNSIRFLRTGWWMVVFPGLTISLIVLSFNWIGDGLNDALNPRLGRR